MKIEIAAKTYGIPIVTLKRWVRDKEIVGNDTLVDEPYLKSYLAMCYKKSKIASNKRDEIIDLNKILRGYYVDKRKGAPKKQVKTQISVPTVPAVKKAEKVVQEAKKVVRQVAKKEASAKQKEKQRRKEMYKREMLRRKYQGTRRKYEDYESSLHEDISSKKTGTSLMHSKPIKSEQKPIKSKQELINIVNKLKKAERPFDKKEIESAYKLAITLKQYPEIIRNHALAKPQNKKSLESAIELAQKIIAYKPQLLLTDSKKQKRKPGRPRKQG